MLGFWCHCNCENGVEDDENGKSFKLHLTFEKKKISLMMTLTVVFYRHSDLQRYAAHVSRPNPHPTHGMHLKYDADFTHQRKDVPSTPPDTWQRV